MLELLILHTNDMHGRLDAMARLSAFAKERKAQAEADGKTVLLWDAGDAADRRVTLCSATKGAGFAPVLNAMGYSLQTVGNDITLPYGPQVMEQVAARAAFPILGANFRNGNAPIVAGLQETVEISLPKGARIGVFGLTAPFDGLYQGFGLDFPNTMDVARQMVTRLQAAGCKAIVALSHLGLPDDREMAERVSGIDVIIGAHTHDYLPNGEMVGTVLIAQTGEYAQHLGCVDLTIDDDGRVVKRSARVLAVPSQQLPDPLVLDAIAEGEREVQALLAEPIGETRAALDVNYFDECGIGALAADALREHMRAEIAIVASGLFHKGLPQGVITRGDLQAACFATANPAATRLNGSQVWAALERGLDPTISQNLHRGFRGTPVGIPQVSGMTVEYDPAAETGARIRRITIDGSPIQADRLYRMAHTDAEAYADWGYFEIAGQQTESQVPIIIGQVMEEYIGRHSPLDAPVMGRWVKPQGGSDGECSDETGGD